MGTQDAVEKHESECIENYNKKSCLTCKHKRQDNLHCFQCELGKEIPFGQYYEQCSQYERAERYDWRGQVNNMFDWMGGIF
jgi:hypothetical protein